MTTVIALLYALVPSVSSAYWILSVMTTQVYLVVYLLMFVAAVKLRRTQPDVERGYTAPALTFICTVGFIASAAAILIGFVPAVAVRERQHGGLRRADRGRHGADRPAAGMAVPQVPQAELEADDSSRRRRHDRAHARSARRVRPARARAVDVRRDRRVRGRPRGDRPDHLQRQQAHRGGDGQGPAAVPGAPEPRPRRARRGHHRALPGHRWRQRLRQPGDRPRARDPVRLSSRTARATSVAAR